MKLQIKTLNQKSLFIDIEDTQTVYELKRELSMYPDIGVRPELQKLIYAGKVLTNDDQLSAYNIDVKKFLVVMVLKQPLAEEAPAIETAATSPKVTANAETVKETKSTSSTASEELKTPEAPKSKTAVESSTKAENDSMVANIVSMGYPEELVRRALAASFNNPERAIEYLIEGIPTSSATAAAAEAEAEAAVYSSAEDDLSMSPFEVFRADPMFQNLRRAIQQHPDLINDVIKHIGESNPAVLSLINENQQEFLSMLIEASDDEDDDEDNDDDNDDDDVYCS